MISQSDQWNSSLPNGLISPISVFILECLDIHCILIYHETDTYYSIPTVKMSIAIETRV